MPNPIDNYSAVVLFFIHRNLPTKDAINLANQTGSKQELGRLTREEVLCMAEGVHEAYTASIPDWFDLIDFD